MNLDTAAKRHAGLTVWVPAVPLPNGADADDTTERAQLVGRYGAFTFVVAVASGIGVEKATFRSSYLVTFENDQRCTARTNDRVTVGA